LLQTAAKADAPAAAARVSMRCSSPSRMKSTKSSTSISRSGGTASIFSMRARELAGMAVDPAWQSHGGDWPVFAGSVRYSLVHPGLGKKKQESNLC
jgi:hypothetical protein